MPLTKTAQPKPLVKKAFRWLKEQPNNWDKHIKDSHIAVKMYQKRQGQKPEEGAGFAQELKSLFSERGEKALKQEPAGAFLAKKDCAAPESLNDEGPLKPPLSSENRGPKTFFVLDKKSQSALEMAQKKLNVKNEEEALRLLIQLGQNSLEKIFFKRP